ARVVGDRSTVGAGRRRSRDRGLGGRRQGRGRWRGPRCERRRGRRRRRRSAGGRAVTRPGYAQLQDVILDPDFPELDLALRRGRHIDRDDVAWYALLGDAQEHLEAFYRRYGCELIHKADGYYYLLPTGDKLSRRQLSAGDMLVGQALALMYLDPAAIERGGRVTMEELIAQLVAVLGSDALIRAFNPKRRRYDERVAQKTARARVAEAVRHLAALGFVDGA